MNNNYRHKKSISINMDKDTLLIVVDTHKKSFCSSTRTIKQNRKIVVIDHHRKSTDFIDNATLSFHEVYASSAQQN